jgi:hypothetical protein
MALTTAPMVYINGTWYQAEWVVGASLDLTDPVSRSMTVRDIQYWKWTVSVDGEPAQVYRLLVAGSSAASIPGGTLTLPVGTYRTRTRITDNPEVIEKASGTFTVTA